ncbi:transcription termination/antitermination factor NusG [Candidatus Uzinura diaspidicola str. ASNER]|uniref:Transcription termination/antitermination protein NusG n=1 Tax=Candidatus Uzinura diaspidicola str. ASNER TaxID=1133592 RepID=L7VJD1_9FLAO|nr:transcription termination/antitermination factor NusG [Candidatus Uzinura diaspidicola str. ASNER]
MRYLSVYYKGFFLRTMHKNWYIIKTISGHENKVKYYLETEIRNSYQKDNIGNIIIPVEKFLQMRNGNKILIERIYFPGYIIIEAFLSIEILHSIKNIPGVIHFLTEKISGKPIPMKKQDITDLLVKVYVLSEAEPQLRISFSLGEKVKVIEGPFKGFYGTIDTINEEKQRMSITVLIFGRKTPLDINFSQVDKI